MSRVLEYRSLLCLRALIRGLIHGGELRFAEFRATDFRYSVCRVGFRFLDEGRKCFLLSQCTIRVVDDTAVLPRGLMACVSAVSGVSVHENGNWR